MQRLHNEAKQLAQKGQAIANEIFKYNPGTNGYKMSVEDIQHMIYALAKDYVELYVDLGKK